MFVFPSYERDKRSDVAFEASLSRRSFVPSLPESDHRYAIRPAVHRPPSAVVLLGQFPPSSFLPFPGISQHDDQVSIISSIMLLLKLLSSISAGSKLGSGDV
jgi:hypothetical protein